MDEEDKMDHPEQPAVGSAGPAGSPQAAASMASKQSVEKALAPQPVQQSASAQRQPREAVEALPAVQPSSASQQQRPLGRESTATTDKQSVATSKTESKLFLVSASTASVVGSAAPGPQAVEPKPSGRASATSGLDGFAKPSGSLLLRGPRSRSAMSFRRPSSSRGSIASRTSRGTATATVDYGLSPGLQSLIGRLTNTKDVGLIAYLSAIPGEPHGATRPPAAINKLQQKQAGRPKSIMKIGKATVRFEPTYRLEPLRPFRVDRALDQVKKALEMGLADATYSPQWATDAVRILAAYITQCVKAAEMPAPNHGSRYKIATVVSVLERCHQGVRTEGAVLWDDNVDRLISACVENNSMVACAVVYAVYWE